MNTAKKPEISERFDLNDIREIREYHSLKHAEMTTAEIIEDIRRNGGETLKWAVEHAARVV